MAKEKKTEKTSTAKAKTTKTKTETKAKTPKAVKATKPEVKKPVKEEKTKNVKAEEVQEKPVKKAKVSKEKQDDTGSVDYQITNFSDKIKVLTKHLQEHPHDFDSRRGLLIMVGKRRRLLNYLRKTNPEQYEAKAKSLKVKA